VLPRQSGGTPVRRVEVLGGWGSIWYRHISNYI
jgi:hypothetical protein